MTARTEPPAGPWRAPFFVGAGVVAASVTGLGVLLDGVSEHADLSTYDPGITSSVASLRRPGLTVAAEIASVVGSEASVGVLSLVALVWLWFVRRERTRATVFAAAMGAAAVLTVLVKHLVERHRPPAAFVLGPVDNGYSFPSGHTLFSSVFFGMVVMLLVWPAANRGMRSIAVIGAVLASLAVGASRVYLGYHWTTDVIAAWVVAVGVITLAFTATTMLGRLSPSPTPAGSRTSEMTERLDSASSPR